MTTINTTIGAATWRRYAPLWPFLNWALFALGAVFVVGALAGAIPYGHGVFGDGTNYWEGLAYSDEHYRYSPAFYWATAPLRLLPLEAFAVVWTALHIAAVAWLAPWMMAFPPVADDTISGNLNTFLALGVVLAVRGHAWTWALPLLTKVTPGVGIFYHVGRREWRAVAVALATTLALVAVTWPLGLWPEWLAALASAPGNYPTSDVLAPLPVRVAAGAVLCLLAARWVWLLPVGMIVAMPGLWPSSFALLAAWPRLSDANKRERRLELNAGAASCCHAGHGTRVDVARHRVGSGQG